MTTTGATFMELRLIRSFVTVAETGHIGRAAELLHISQPPLTRQIQQFETDMDVRLFTRTPRGVQLTDAGLIFLEDARKLLQLADLARERARRASLGKLGRLDVGISGSAVFDSIPKILLAFRQDNPDVHLVLHAMRRSEQIDALRQRRINLGFTRFLRDAPDLVAERISGEPLFVAVSGHSPFYRMKHVALKQLSGVPLVLFPAHPRPSFMDFVLDLFRREGFAPEVSQEVGDAGTATALVGSGFGACIVPRSATNVKVSGVVYRPLVCKPPQPMVDHSVIYRADDQSAVLHEFLKVVDRFRTSSPA
jgi:DNA-binding transcriptional LysR family regulator